MDDPQKPIGGLARTAIWIATSVAAWALVALAAWVLVHLKTPGASAHPTSPPPTIQAHAARTLFS